MGKAIRASSVKIRLGKSSALGMFFVDREKGLFLSVYVDDMKNWLARNRTSIRLGKYS